MLRREFGKKRVEYKKLSGPALQELRNKWHGTRFLIIDEISMVSYETLEFIHRRLQEIFDTPSRVYFGGLSVICVGDLFQLPPVKAEYLFAPPDSINNSPGLLWSKFKAFGLTSNHRQQGDPTWARHLNAIRDCMDENAVQETLQALRTRLDISKNSRGVVNLRDAEWENAPRCASMLFILYLIRRIIGVFAPYLIFI
jgi:hypothetical protein